MLDPYNRDINYLRISVTDRCNLRCTYCRPKEGISLKGHEDILRYEEILRVVSRATALGFVKVRLTGGEPLVRRGFVEFAAALKKIKGLEDISLTTNGILLEKYADAIFNAGITRINISLDSLDGEKYAEITRGGNLEDVFRGIAEAEKAGFSPIKINTVIVRGFNDNEVLDFARLALTKPFQIRFIEIMPVSPVNTGHAEDFLPNRQLLETIGRHFRLLPLQGKKHKTDGPARLYKLEEGRGEIGFINPVSDHFCATCNRLRLMADGKLRACLLKEEEVDLKAALERRCSDEELDELIRKAVRFKPEKHDLDCTDRHLKKCHRDMSDIGG
ncbi:MAG TPA: GTP 3',8-cyclase MoaA [Smithellaceae bacterium]|nr:GTP 3',8-cyclase MoaA [Smithellaceae bacterium]HRS83315.1 GTP 3',8-cyclase MoaA [Smithellaceae bacterium]HRV45735.1 GTP 3',8-cyclase MoaA [Smithellaceae bacterium]